MVWLTTSEFVKEYFIVYFRVDGFYKVGGGKHLSNFSSLGLLIFWFIQFPNSCTASGCEQKFNTKSNLKKHF